MTTNRIPGRAARHLAAAARGERPTRSVHPGHEASGDPQEFARSLAAAQQSAGVPAGVETGGRGRGFPESPEQPVPPSPDSPAGIEGWIAGSAGAASPPPVSFGAAAEAAAGPAAGPTSAQLAELAERLVKAARVVAFGDRSSIDVELAGGLLGVSRVQVRRTGGGGVRVSLAVDHAEGAKRLEQRLDSLAAALGRRGVANASIAVDTGTPRSDVLAPRGEAEVRSSDEPAARHLPGDGGSNDGRSRGRQGRQGRQREAG